MVKTIIFDLGNVIVKVDKSDQFRKMAKYCNKPISYISNFFEKSSMRMAFERGELNPKEYYEKVVRKLNCKISFTNFKKIYCDIFTLNTDVAKLIKKLKKKFRLVLLSNTDKLHFEYIKNKYEIVGSFDEHVLSYEVGHRKPNRSMFLNAIRKAKAISTNCVYVDDIPEFVHVAKLMGMKAFQFKTYGKLTSDLKGANVLN